MGLLWKSLAASAGKFAERWLGLTHLAWCGHWGRSHTSGVSDDQQWYMAVIQLRGSDTVAVIHCSDQQWYMAVIQLRGSDTRPANAVNCVLSSSTTTSSQYKDCTFVPIPLNKDGVQSGTIYHVIVSYCMSYRVGLCSGKACTIG